MFTRATKRTTKLRAALFGPSGSGKTFSALRIAKGIGGRLAVIDTERGSASKYADRFEFDVLELHKKAIPDYVAALAQAQEAGYEVLILDSLSHAWQELVAEVEKIAAARFKGNTWSAWSEGTPKQRALVDAILAFPGHVLATMRSKTEWSLQADGGKSRPVRVGLAPEQGKGIEYEFDLLLELSAEHVCNCIKDRTGRFQDRLIEKPGEDLGRELVAWLSEGAMPAPAAAEPEQEDFDKTFPSGAVPQPPEKPKPARSFKFLKAMTAMKETLGEPLYREILADEGYEHANEITGRENQERVYRALKERAERKQEAAADQLPM